MMLKNYATTKWFANTRASAHMTGNLDMIQKLCRYLDIDAIIIGDDNTHSMSVILILITVPLKLN